MGIWSDQSYLERCERLSRWGVRPRFIEGERVARGFADLGYEEFCMLPSRKMVSLFSGTVSTLPPDHEHFFFLVPTIEDLLAVAGSFDLDCESVSFRDQRTWAVTLREGESLLSGEGRSLEECFVDALLLCPPRKREER